MAYFWIPFSLILLSLFVLLFIVIRKIPYLRTLDVLSTSAVKVRHLKNSLVSERLLRVGTHHVERFGKIFTPIAHLTKAGAKLIASHIAKLEEHYQKLKRESAGQHTIDVQTLKHMIEEAEAMIKEERYGEAEKKLIEVVSHDAKNVLAYETLAYLYLELGSLEQAEETYQFILKMNPTDASVLTGLGEIELKRKNPKKAKTYFAKAVKKRPNNPKYLDYLLEASIMDQDKEQAEKALTRLKNVNPENQKLEEFENRIKKIGN